VRQRKGETNERGGAAFKRLGAGASVTGWLAPLAAAIAAVGLLRVEAKNITLVDLTRPEQLLLISVLIGVGAWVISLLLYLPLTGPKRANFRSYSLLRNRIEGLRARREVVCRGRNHGPSVCSEVDKSLDTIVLCMTSGSGIWVQGGGYIAGWEAVHRAEELLMEAEDGDALLEDAEHDILRLTDSKIPHKDELLELIKAAKKFLCDGKQKDSCVNSIEAARKVLREVRFNVNVFRDSTWNGLVTLRSRTMAALLLIQLTAFALLALAILMGANKDAVSAAALYFLVGALFGVFNLLYTESQADTAVDDYGLATARMLTLPAVSGLAGLGGVLFVSLAANETTANLASQFDFQKHPLQLLVAAAFGATPGVLAKNLAAKAQTYQSDIKSTEPTDGGTEPRK
jgi:hypothetical protein